MTDTYAHSVEAQLMGLSGAWVPTHRQLSRLARQRCHYKAALQKVVVGVVLELWQEQQRKRSAKKLSARVLVSTRELVREVYGDTVSMDTGRRSVKRALQALVKAGLLEDTGEQGPRQQSVYSVAPLLEAVAAECDPDRRREASGGEKPPEATGTGGDMPPSPEATGLPPRRRDAPGHRRRHASPSKKETSPPVPGGEERSRSGDDGRAGLSALPPPPEDKAEREREWQRLEDALRDRRRAAVGRSAEERTAAVLLRQAQVRDERILATPLIVELLAEIRTSPPELAVAS